MLTPNSQPKSGVSRLISLVSLTSAFLLHHVSAQVVGFTNDAGYSVAATLYLPPNQEPGMQFDISAPANASWVGFGLGTNMVGGDLMLAWADPANAANVILSRKSGITSPGGGAPTVETATTQDLILLPGSGVSDGKLNVKFVRPFSSLPNSPPFDFLWAMGPLGQPFDGANAQAMPPAHPPNSRGTFNSEFVLQAAVADVAGNGTQTANNGTQATPTSGTGGNTDNNQPTEQPSAPTPTSGALAHTKAPSFETFAMAIAMYGISMLFL
ncbi:hypothetical protein HK102_002685 [Quaeritorhiza haematococci]|nr:hypothetical protein HK102_002685 [Quaeritorhiza haematococci]